MASSGFFVLNVNLKGENNMGNLIQYIAQEDPEKNRPWQTSVPQNNFCKTKSTILSKPKYTRIPTHVVFRPAKLPKADWKVLDKVLSMARFLSLMQKREVFMMLPVTFL
jgi:hypothetical protein